MVVVHFFQMHIVCSYPKQISSSAKRKFELKHLMEQKVFWTSVLGRDDICPVTAKTGNQWPINYKSLICVEHWWLGLHGALCSGVLDPMLLVQNLGMEHFRSTTILDTLRIHFWPGLCKPWGNFGNTPQSLDYWPLWGALIFQNNN